MTGRAAFRGRPPERTEHVPQSREVGLSGDPGADKIDTGSDPIDPP